MRKGLIVRGNTQQGCEIKKCDMKHELLTGIFNRISW